VIPTSDDLIGAAILSGAFLLLIVVAEVWRRLRQPKPEWTRKLVHMGGGVVALFFPFMIESPWVILAMALALSGIFTVAARSGFLRSLHGVERKSRGAEYYPLVIWLVFLLTQGRVWLYVSAVLVLAVGDAFAALVGSRYGVFRYEVEDEHKSLEGSLVFLVIAFLAIHLPMLLLTDLSRETCVLAAVLVAVLVTGFEAISLQGTDNLFVPLGVVIILGKITTKPLAEIVFQNISLAAIILATVLLVRRFPVFNVGGTIVVILYAYGNWSLGSWHWALPIFAGLLTYVLLWVSLAWPKDYPRLRVRVVAGALVVPALILAAANGTGHFAMLFGPYLAAIAAVFAFAATTPVFRLSDREGWRRPMGVIGITLLTTGVTVFPAWAVQTGTPLPAFFAIPAVVLVVTYILVLLDRLSPVHSLRQWTPSRFLLCVAAAGVILALQALRIIPAWIPI
jgi:dolichol kinase